MNKPIYNEAWPSLWKEVYHYDQMEFFNADDGLGYTRAYKKRFTETINAIIRYLTPGSSILDVAAAQGNFSIHLAELGYNVTWNDIRSNLVDYVKLKDNGLIKKFEVGNIFSYSPAEKFDAVLITEIIEHVAHPDAFLEHIASLLKPGGFIILTTPNGAFFRNKLPKFSAFEHPEEFENLQFQPNSDGHIFLLYPEELVDLGQKAGLKLLELKAYNNVLTSGFFGMAHIAPLLGSRFIKALEAKTSKGDFFNRINTNLLAVFKTTR